MFSDTDGKASTAFDLLTDRTQMAGTSTPMRAVFVVDADRTVRYRWVADDWISPAPRPEIEDAIATLE
jgi:peroxiredoxin